MPLRAPTIVGGAVALAGVTIARPALACSIAIQDLRIEADPLDTVAPGGISNLMVADITRGIGPDCNPDDTCVSSSCDDIGAVTLRFTLPVDDRTPSEAHGYITWIEEGHAPDYGGALELVEPRMAVVNEGEGRLSISWIDGATDRQEAIDLVIAVAPVDASGREGPPSYVRVLDAASMGTPSGCAHTQAAPVGLLGCTALGLLFVARRRAGTPSTRALVQAESEY